MTVEIEHVNVDALDEVRKLYPKLKIHPAPATIRLIQDKFLQKEHFSKHDIPLAPFLPAADKAAIIEAAAQFGYPLMLKSRKLAYDGRGNAVVNSEDEIDAALASLVSKDVYVEKMMTFTKELAVMVARSALGDTVVSYPTVETIQKVRVGCCSGCLLLKKRRIFTL